MGLEKLTLYPTERTSQLLAGIKPEQDSIDCTIGEPQHRPPSFIIETHNKFVEDSIGKYPKTKQIAALTEAIATYAKWNLDVLLGEQNILAIAGSGEGLFSMPLFAGNLKQQRSNVVIPNPSYKVYEGATILANSTPVFAPLTKDNNFQIDFGKIHPADLSCTSLAFINYPSNPCGVNATRKTIENAIEASQKYDFILASDECYLDIYFGDERPLSALTVAKDMGIKDYKNILVFNSLSKRSSVPGLRSGFMAGDPDLIKSYLRMRMMERKTLPEHVQMASAAAWRDDVHVGENRALYKAKLDDFCSIVDRKHYQVPESAFYVWFQAPRAFSSESFTKSLFEKTGVKVLPGSYLQHTETGPATNYVRIALVHEREKQAEAAKRIQSFIGGMK